MIKNDMQLFLSSEAIATMVNQIANEISRTFKGESVILIAPLKGSILFATDLARKLSIPCKLDFVQLKSNSKGSSIFFEKDVQLELKGENVIIVEEIIDEGRKLNFLQNRLLLAQPKSIKIATLIDKPSRRVLPVHPDYVGQVIEDRYVVGYGMDSEELGRNYKDIYMLKN